MTITRNTASADRNTLKHDDTPVPRKPLGLYLHIPFCIRKCNYCDFLSFSGVPEKEQKAYFRALVQEIRLNGEIYSNKYSVDSIFIGGGTPSLVDEESIREMMSAVQDSFSVTNNVEITIETNPKTLTKRKLDTYLDAGINRLSLGVQALDDQLLHDLGRAHSKGDFLNNYCLARDCGFRNINLDLMFGIPGQTMRIWKNTLEQAIALDPEHISFYSLQLEEGTAFFTMREEGRLQQIEDRLDREMYHDAIRMLSACEYRHYEISNGAKTGFECRHNLKYWSMEDYLGLGLGAHSFMDGIRFSNRADLKEYISHSASFPEQGSVVQWEHRNSQEENIAEYLFTGLRKVKGIELADFMKRFGTSMESRYKEVLEKHQTGGLIQIEDGWLHFTEKGLDLSNIVLSDFV